MHPSKLASTRALQKAIALFVTVLMVANLSPFLAQAGPTPVLVQEFANGQPVINVQLDAHKLNTSAGISIYKNTKIDTASLMLEGRGLETLKTYDFNRTDDFLANKNNILGTEAHNGSVHLVPSTQTLALSNDADFQGGNSSNVVADYGVHLASGVGTWDQRAFISGPGNLFDSSGTGFDSSNGMDWSTGDGALRLSYYYKYLTTATTGVKPVLRAGTAYATDPSGQTMYIYGGWNVGGLKMDSYRLRVQNLSWYRTCDPCSSMPAGLTALGNATMVYNTVMSFPEMTGGDLGISSIQAKTWAMQNMCMTYFVPMSDLVNARSGQSEIFDSADHLAIVFGGMDSLQNPTKTVYEKGNDTIWRDITGNVQNLPPTRFGHSAVWDPVGKKMYVFGGTTGTGTYYNDLYSFDPVTSQFALMPNGGLSGKPQPRAYQGAMWDPTNKAMIIIGGRDATTVFSDLWVYWPYNSTWARLPFSTSGNDNRWSMATTWLDARGQGTVWGGMNDLGTTAVSDDVIQIQGQYSNIGAMTSSVVDAGSPATWDSVFISTKGVFGANPTGTMKFEIRTGTTKDPNDGSWTVWSAPDINNSFEPQNVMPGQYMQYRLTLTSFTSRETPVVYNLTFVYSVEATSGTLTTHEYDLGQSPLYFTGMAMQIWDSPPFTRTKIAIDYSDTPGGPYTSITFTDNQTLAMMPTGRYIRFYISMSSSFQGISPYLISLSLGYVVLPPVGVFQLDLLTDSTETMWFQADWNVTDGRPGRGLGGAGISVEVEGKYLELTKGVRVDVPHPPFTTNKIMVNITLKTDGHSDPRLNSLSLKIAGNNYPSAVTLDIGNDNSVELDWPGPHLKGNVTQVPMLRTALSDFLASPKAVPDNTGHVLIPLALWSKTPGIVVLRDLSIGGSIANVPPNIVSQPPLTAKAGVDYKYPVKVDNKVLKDLNFTIVRGPPEMLFSDNVLLWTPPFTTMNLVDVTIAVSDGIDKTLQSWTIIVDNNSTGHLPQFIGWPDHYQSATGTVPMRYGDSFSYHLDVIDQDVADIVTLSLERGPKGMTLTGQDLIWKTTDTYVGNFTVILRAFDGKGSAYQTFRITIGPNKAPTIDRTIPTLKVKAGNTLTYKVLASDQDKDTLTFSLLGAPTWMTIDNQGTISGKPGTKDAGTKSFKVLVSDGHLNTTADVTVAVAKDTKILGMARDDLIGLLVILLVVCIVVIVVAFVVVRSRKKKAKDAKLEAEIAPTKPAPGQSPPVVSAYHQPAAQAAPVAVEAPLPQPTVPLAEPVKEDKPVIEEIYFIYNDGRLIAHESSKGGMAMDEHVLSGMLKAIQEFVKDSFQKEGALGGLDYGDSRIMLESGNCATFAIVLKGKETKALREETRRALEKIEGLYAGVIECWDGDVAHFGDVKKYFGPIFALGKTQEEQAEAGEVKVLSALEFYQGYVRLKAAVKNTYPFMVYEVTLKILYDKKAMQLTYIEPEYEREGSEVLIGNIPPNEKKTVNFYLDPLICMESSIDATALFKNYKGELKTVLMKRRPVDIVCPIFYTEQNVNVAMLKRLITELKYKDSKIYTIPKSMLPSQAIDLAKSVISARDVKFVREFIEETPFTAEAWFYGKTKHTLEDLVIRATMREENGLLEIFVCSNNLATLPGLLADLGHGIKKRYMELKKTKDGLTQVTDVKVKDELEKSRLLIDKYVSTEAEAHSDENEL